MTETASRTVEDVIAAYVKLRSVKDQREAAHKAEQKKITEKLTKLEAWLHMKMHVDKVKGFNTNAGTAHTFTVEQATVADMDALLEYVRENEAWHLLEKRVSKTGVRALLDENQPLPPGVNWSSSTVIHVRKPNER